MVHVPIYTACLGSGDVFILSGLGEQLVMAVRMRRTGTFQSFTSFISAPDFVDDEGHQPHSYPNFLVNLGIVGSHGDPDLLNKALKHLK